MGSRTVLSGSVSRGKDNPSESLQMMERPLMTADELKSMPKGQFVVMKTGFYPMKVHLKLFFEWGITFDEANPFCVSENGNREIHYASKTELRSAILAKYPPKQLKDAAPQEQPASETPHQPFPDRNRPYRSPVKTEPPRTGAAHMPENQEPTSEPMPEPTKEKRLRTAPPEPRGAEPSEPKEEAHEAAYEAPREVQHG